MSAVSWCQCPDHDHNDQETDDVDDQQDVLNRWQGFGHPDVEEKDDGNHAKHEEGALPVGGTVIGVVDGCKTLDDRSR